MNEELVKQIIGNQNKYMKEHLQEWDNKLTPEDILNSIQKVAKHIRNGSNRGAPSYVYGEYVPIFHGYKIRDKYGEDFYNKYQEWADVDILNTKVDINEYYDVHGPHLKRYLLDQV